MPGEPQISLIVSCYNQNPWMDTVLSSAIAQDSATPFEILLCDDGSNDGVFETVRRLASSSDVDLRYVWQPDRGFRLSRSRNNGIRSARGSILVFVDGDTWLAPSFLHDHWNAHRKPG